MLDYSYTYAGCPSVCPVGILTVTHQGPACDAASIHFSLTVRRIDVLVAQLNSGIFETAAIAVPDGESGA